MKVIFFGTPSFAAECLKELLNEDVDVLAVVTMPDRPRGRSSQLQSPPVKEIAEERGILVLQPEKISRGNAWEPLEELQPDLFVVVAYGEIIKRRVLSIPKKGAINLHASLLPKYRGAAPIQHAIIEGETETGVTVMHLAEKMDAGDIIAQSMLSIGAEETYEELQNRLCALGSKLLAQVVLQFARGNVAARPQDNALVTFAPKIDAEQCRINWSSPASILQRLIHGVSPRPGAWCEVQLRDQKKRCKITRAAVVRQDDEAGNILSWDEEGIVVACGQGALRLLELQVEGKRKMSGKEFAIGHHRVHFSFV